MELLSLSAVQLGRAIREGRTTAVKAMEAVLGRIEEKEEWLNCYITLDKEGARRRAQETQKRIEAGELRGPLAGVPMAVKDNLCTRGMRTTCGSRMLETFVPAYSADAVMGLERAGAVLVGKTNMDEFAMGSTTENSFYGPTRNPWNTDHVPGGSSGGSAAAVAARGVCPTAGGSLWCGGNETYLWDSVPIWAGGLCFLHGPDRSPMRECGGLRGCAGGNRRNRP